MIILIPAYEPDTKLIDLVAAIGQRSPNQQIVLVDDGSGPGFDEVFRKTQDLGCTVLTHERNLGKGVALRTGFSYIVDRWPGSDVVCADCDGQHRLDDITKVAEALECGAAPIVLGARSFTGAVPLRSRFGNSVTGAAFAMATGKRLTDTQTGLRGYRSGLLDWLGTVDGDRFEYELNVLLAARTRHVEVAEVPIETIYLDDNASSHFRPLVDSARIYAPLLRFTLSSLGAFAVDFVAFLVLMALGVGLGWSVVGARALSSTFNYLTNRRFVFADEGSKTGSAFRYFSLVALLLGFNYSVLRTLITGLSMNVVVAKVFTESTLFAFSYLMQRRYVFAGAAHDPTPIDHGDRVPARA